MKYSHEPYHTEKICKRCDLISSILMSIFQSTSIKTLRCHRLNGVNEWRRGIRWSGRGMNEITNWSKEDFYQINIIHSFWDMDCTFHQSPKSNDINLTKSNQPWPRPNNKSQTQTSHHNWSTKLFGIYSN